MPAAARGVLKRKFSSEITLVVVKSAAVLLQIGCSSALVGTGCKLLIP